MEPQICSNYDVEDGDDGERQKVDEYKNVTPEGQRRYNSVSKRQTPSINLKATTAIDIKATATGST